MTHSTVNWFEIPVRDIKAAVEFYGTMLGTALGDMPGPDGEPMHVFLGPDGPTGALVLADADNPIGGAGPVLYLNCPDMDAALERAGKAGATVRMSKTAIGPYGFIGQVTDPCGNRVALHCNA